MSHTLLIADDSPSKVLLIQMLLGKAKWERVTLLANDTNKAKKIIDENDVGFALIDYYMPSENGPAVIKYLKQKNPNARIALVSSSDKQSNFAEAKEAGAEACICTTYESDVVEKTMMDLLEEWKNS